MKILVINCGSSSFKYQLIDMTNQQPLCSGLVERIGDSVGNLIHKKAPGTDAEAKHSLQQPFKDHTAGMEAVMQLLVDKQWGVIGDLKEIAAVGHRVVQGGEALQKSCIVGAAEKKTIQDQAALAPLHNPANLQGIDVAQKLLPHAPSVAVFDTEFHATMPPHAYMYALPYELYEELRIRRYGFHGTSHRFVTEGAAAFLNKPLDQFNCITCHLGNGSSITAVANGKCVDTSMGMTPLPGVVMGTRCGDIDPAIPLFIAEHKGLSLAEVDNLMNKQSGFKGICGQNDMRDIHSSCEKGDAKAQLAVDMFSYSILKYIGAYFAALGRVDAIIFTAGIGENDDIVRKAICTRLTAFGIELDEKQNAIRSGDVRAITTKSSRVPVLVVPTNEELAIAKATETLIK